ncbi:peptide ABC transporter substrate-binding protein [Sellimonas catena]|uniref:Peptide ABC transporter substrate-binding protein n=1 Tax=Sellimonas catena TaxID=2994035 RepID=A0A9W6CH40_9FIRM|nr:peptide ABC transporter substrate-binding protein [Sellimonas catena]GLG91169.1 peptide ABC transporter substrate-binding protein [Sellimonas catena]
MKKRVLACLLAAVMTAGLLAGCGGGEKSGGGGSSEQVLNISTNSVVVGLNPLVNTTAPDNIAHNMIYDPLIRDRSAKDNTDEIVPAAAESWDVSEDGLTYTFHMNPDAKWSDGSKVTANDFEFTFKQMADPNTAATNAWLFDGVIVNFSEALYNNGKTPDEIGVKALDEETLEIQLVHPASYFLQLVAGSAYPVNQAKYEEYGSEYGTAPDKTVYNGPLKVTSWNQNTEMVLEKNDQYWGQEDMQLDKVNYKVIQESSTAVQAFINGELDVVSTSDTNWGKTITAAGDSQEMTVPSSAPDFFMFNLKNEYLSNTKIRQALSIAFDRQEMVDTLRDGMSVPIYSMMPDTMKVGDKTYTELVDGKNYFVTQMQEEYTDPKALLQEGLAELGKSTDPSQMTIRYASRGTSELSKKIGEWMKQVWEEKLGIYVQIDMMEWNIMWDKIDAGDYDIACGGWGPYYNEPSALLQPFEPVNGYFNADKTGWNNEDSQKFTELLNQAKDVVDDKEKAEIYLQAEQLVVGNALIAPMYLEASPTYVKNHVKNYYVTTNGLVDFSQVSVEN